jgi:hypothetical protein
MTSFSGGEKMQAILAELASKVSRPGTLRVGFLENATYPDGTSVPMVAAVNEFGAPSRGIPPRPFFRTMVTQNSPAWGPALGGLVKNFGYDATKALEAMGQGISGQLRKSIQDTNSPPLAQSTIDRKGSAKPLVDTGHMLQSIDYDIKSS